MGGRNALDRGWKLLDLRQVGVPHGWVEEHRGVRVMKSLCLRGSILLLPNREIREAGQRTTERRDMGRLWTLGLLAPRTGLTLVVTRTGVEVEGMGNVAEVVDMDNSAVGVIMG